jgi:hypothetical protein
MNPRWFSVTKLRRHCVRGSAPIITKAHITRVNVDHLSLISNPGVVTQVIIKAARATG